MLAKLSQGRFFFFFCSSILQPEERTDAVLTSRKALGHDE